MEIKREKDNTFKCKCGKSFNYPDSVRKHVKGCNGKLIESEEDGNERWLTSIDDTDVSELMKVDNRIIPTDCFGMPIPHEKH